MDKATVIVPVYNGAGCIKKCLDSIIGQTYRCFEVIVVDDGSDDGSSEIIDSYAWEHNGQDIKVIHKENGGVATARNAGIEKAEGDWLFFVDQDDLILPDYIEKYMDVIAVSEYDIVLGGYDRVNKNDKKARYSVALKKGDWAPFVVVAPWAHMYRADFIKEHGICFLDHTIGEDIFFNLVALSYTERVHVIEGDHSYKWTDNSASVSNSRQRVAVKEIDPLYLFQAMERSFPENTHVAYALMQYFYLRYSVWYISFVAARSSRKALLFRYEKLFSWLDENYSGYETNPYVRKMPQGELLKVWLAVRAVLFLRKTRLDRSVLRMAAGRKRRLCGRTQ